MMPAVIVWDLQTMLIAIIIIAACCAVVYLVLTQGFDIKIPPWVIKVLWICIGAFIAIVAIRFLLSL